MPKITDYNDDAVRQALLTEARRKEKEDAQATLQGKPRATKVNGVSID